MIDALGSLHDCLPRSGVRTVTALGRGMRQAGSFERRKSISTVSQMHKERLCAGNGSSEASPRTWRCFSVRGTASQALTTRRGVLFAEVKHSLPIPQHHMESLFVSTVCDLRLAASRRGRLPPPPRRDAEFARACAPGPPNPSAEDPPPALGSTFTPQNNTPPHPAPRSTGLINLVSGPSWHPRGLTGGRTRPR